MLSQLEEAIFLGPSTTAGSYNLSAFSVCLKFCFCLFDLILRRRGKGRMGEGKRGGGENKRMRFGVWMVGQIWTELGDGEKHDQNILYE